MKSRRTFNRYNFWLVILFSFVHKTSAQEFKISLSLEDYNGSLDTVILGYDAMATDTIDDFFQEKDISNQELGVFDVRSYFLNSFDCFSHSIDSEFSTKIDIRQNDCLFKEFCLGIPINNLPVNVSWEINSEVDHCYSHSQISDTYSNYWPPLPVECNYTCLGTNRIDDTGSITISENCVEKVTIDGGVTLGLVFIQILETDTSVEPIASSDIQIYPNPFVDLIYIQNEDFFSSIHSISIYDLNGNLQNTVIGDYTKLNLRHLPNGLYVLKVRLSRNNYLIKRITKF